MATVHVHSPGTPDGADVEVPGLGVFPNNSSAEVTDEQIAVFNVINAAPFPEDGVLHVPSLPVEPEEAGTPDDGEEPVNPFFNKTTEESD